MDKTKTTGSVEYSKIRVKEDVTVEIIREADTEDPWDRDDTREYHHILGIEKTDDYYDFEVDFSVEKNIAYYLVYGLYSTGDSFGYDEGKIHFIDLFQNKVVAEACAKEAETTSNKQKSSFTYLGDSLEPLVDYVPWTGYFEGLENIRVEKVYLNET